MDKFCSFLLLASILNPLLLPLLPQPAIADDQVNALTQTYFPANVLVVSSGTSSPLAWNDPLQAVTRDLDSQSSLAEYNADNSATLVAASSEAVLSSSGTPTPAKGTAGYSVSTSSASSSSSAIISPNTSLAPSTPSLFANPALDNLPQASDKPASDPTPTMSAQSNEVEMTDFLQGGGSSLPSGNTPTEPATMPAVTGNQQGSDLQPAGSQSTAQQEKPASPTNDPAAIKDPSSPGSVDTSSDQGTVVTPDTDSDNTTDSGQDTSDRSSSGTDQPSSGSSASGSSSDSNTNTSNTSSSDTQNPSSDNTSSNPLTFASSPHLEYSGFALDSQSPSLDASATPRSLSVNLSLAGLSNPNAYLSLEYSVSSSSWMSFGQISFDEVKSNLSNNGYFRFYLPKELIKDISSLKVRLTYFAPGQSSVTFDPSSPLFYLDGLWLDADYNKPLVEEDLEDPEFSTSTPESFFKLDFANSLMSLSMPGDLTSPITVSGKDKNLYSFQMLPLGVSQQSAGQRVGDKIIYPEAYQSTDLEYFANDKGLKENIILKDNDHPANFKYWLNLDAYDYQQVSPNRIDLFKKGKKGNPLFKLYSLAAPMMIDSLGNSSDRLTFKLSKNTLTLIPNASWLKAAVYPVTIDPNVEISVLNVVSYPTAGDYWTIDFTTIGQSDLTVTPVDQATIDDMQFDSLTCDGNAIPAIPGDNGAISSPNWSCDGIGEIKFFDSKTGHHHMVFNFGGVTADAYNGANTWVGGIDTNWETGGNWSSGAKPTSADDVVISSAVIVNINASTTVNSLTLGVSGGGTASVLNFNYDASTSPLTTVGDLTIYSGASITHTVGTSVVVGRINITVGGNATVNGSITADGKGYAAGKGPGYSNSVNCSGATYGGMGGANPIVPYGSITIPTDLGSGGSAAGGYGGTGGGSIQLTVTGTTTVASGGSISANGTSGGDPSYNGCGAGASGGSIYLTTGNLSGSGSIKSIGGNGVGNWGALGGAGSGGRISVYYTTDSSSITYSTYSGSSNSSSYGGSGTLYRKNPSQTYGDLILDNNNFGGLNETLFGRTPLVASTTFDSITASSSASFYLSQGVTVTTTSLTLKGNGHYDAKPGNSLNYTSINWAGGIVTDSGGIFTLLNQDQDLIIPTSSKLTINVPNATRTYNNLTINGTLVHTANSTATTGTTSLYKINYSVNGDLNIGSSGSINADAKGYPATKGSGAGITNNVGGSYGGLGVGNSTASVYGSLTAPTDLGSGGNQACGSGAAGGGAIILTVTGTTILNGSALISANGADGTAPNYCGSNAGGSGGSVYLTTGTLSGSGTISAKGGIGSDGGYGWRAVEGGGGRIAVYYTTDNSTISYQAYGAMLGNSNPPSGAGTVYKKAPSQSYGDLILDNNNLGGTNEMIFGKTPLGAQILDSITITKSATLFLSASSATTTALALSNNGVYDAQPSTHLAHTSINWNATVLDSGGTLTAVNQNSDLTIPAGGKLVVNVPNASRTYNNLTINGILTHAPNTSATTGTASLYKIDYTVNGDLTIGSSGSINVDGKGYVAGQGPGTTADWLIGASHGGFGGGNTVMPYGSLAAPVTLGSGGGNTNAAGAGAIKLTVSGTTNIASGGIITAVGLPGDNSCIGPCGSKGSGAGGSIYLTTGILVGSGTITANGGVTAGTGGGGGGGRVALYYTTDNSSIVPTAYGGNGSAIGGAGTYYKKAASQTYGDLILDNNNQGGITSANFGKTPVDSPLSFDNFTVKGSSALQASSSVTYLIYGNLTVSTSTASTTTVAFQLAGSAAQTITQVGPFGLPALSINKSSATATLASNLFASSTLSVLSGGFDSNGKTITVLSNFTQSGGTFIAPASTLSVSGNFSHTSGTFNPNNGTVNLTGTNQTITGATTFYNLTKSVTTTDTLTFTTGDTQTITNILTLTGASSNLLSLRSSASGTRFNIDPQGTRTINYLDVKDSNNANALVIDAVNKNSVDSGNNFNWIFVAPTFTQSQYQFFQNSDSLQPGIALGSLSATTTLTTTTPIRLRMNVNVTNLPANYQGFRLQVSTSTVSGWLNIIPRTDWLSANWKNRKKITFNNASSTENLINFPVLVSLTSSNIDYAKTNASGTDIRFTDSDGITQLNYEIEKWDNTATSTAWVKVPQIDASSNTDYIWMYYNNPSANVSAATTTGVWDESYQGVYHLKNGTTLSGADSSLKNNNLVNNGTVAAGAGKYDGGAYFDGNDRYLTANSNYSFMDGASQFTVDVWAYTNDTGNRTYFSKWAGNYSYDVLFAASGGTLFAQVNNGADGSGSVSYSLAGTWKHLVLVYDGTQPDNAGRMKIYADGKQQALGFAYTVPATTSNIPSAYGTFGGYNHGDYRMYGYLDEARVSNVARSASYIQAEYLTGSGQFNTFGNEESVGDSGWKFYNNPSLATSVNISTLLLGSSNAQGTYNESNPTTVNPFAASTGDYLEYDFALDPSGILANTTYYFRLAKSDGIALDAYDNYPALVWVFTPASVSTSPATVLTNLSAQANGNLISLGQNSSLTDYGFVYGASANPDLDNNLGKVSLGATSTTGSFSGTISGLDPSTTYHYRAYAVNAAGVAASYGEDVSFTTTGNPTFTQSQYQFFQNADALQPGSPLGSLNSTTTITTTSSPIRLRMNIALPDGGMAADYQAFKLQVSTSTASGWSDIHLTLGTGSSDWWNYSWSNRRKITFNNASSSEDLTNFPVLVSLTSSNINYAKTNASGTDLRFTDSSGTALNYEIEKWDNTATSTVWVKVPTIHASSTTDYIWMYYNNTSATTSTATTTGVWDSNYALVQHLGETSGTTVYDSTNNQNNGSKVTATEPLSTSTGQIDGAQYFDGNNDYLSVTDSASTRVGNKITISFWVKKFAQTNYGMYVTKNVAFGGGNNSGWYQLMNFNTSGRLSFRMTNDSDDFVSTGSVPLSSWTFVTATYDGATGKMFLNGAQDATTISKTVTPAQSATALSIGRRTDGYYNNAEFDEVRISSIARSPSWVRAEYLTDSNQYNTYGSEETVGSTAWRFYNNPSIATSVNISALLLSYSNIQGTYSEANPVAPNPFAASTGQYIEYDFALDPSGILANTTYYFRLVKADGTVLDTYSNYPAVQMIPDQTPNAPTGLGPSSVTDGGWLNTPTPAFTFTLSDPDALDQVKYHIQISTSSDFSSTAIDYTSGLMSQGSATYTPAFLPDGSYYWRVSALDQYNAVSSWTTANSGSVAFKVDATAPTAGALSLDNVTTDSVAVSITGANDAFSGLSASPYVFTNVTTGASQAATSAASTIFSGLSANTSYTFKVTVSDLAGNAADTALISTTTLASANPPPSGGSGGGGGGNPPTPPSGGFRVTINNGDPSTNASSVILTLSGGDAKTMTVSNKPDFSGASQEPYASSKTWNLCSGLSSCPDGTYTVYVKFYSASGIAANPVSDSISLDTSSVTPPEPPPAAFTVALSASLDQKKWATEILQNVLVGQKVSLKAALSMTASANNITYQFDCSSDGKAERLVEHSKKTVYTANKLCSYPKAGVYTAHVAVTLDNYTAISTISIAVNAAVPPPPPPPNHTACQKNACVVVAGYGTDSCHANIDCSPLPPPSHTVCQDQACVVVAGEGINACVLDGDCRNVTPPATHNVCQKNACVTVTGPGPNECQSSRDCRYTPVTHSICQDNACIIVEGTGTNQCSKNLDCSQIVILPPTTTPPVNPPVVTNPPQDSGQDGETLLPPIGNGGNNIMDSIGSTINTVTGATKDLAEGAANAVTEGSRLLMDLARTTSKTVVNTSRNIKGVSKKTIDQLANNTTSAQATAGISTVAIAPTAIAMQYSLATQGLLINLSSFSELWLYLLHFLYGLLTTLGLRARRRYWGTVYDSQTKQPLDPAIVELVNFETAEVAERSITDIFGRYGFLDRPGKYIIRAKKTNYQFPSSVVKNKVDGMFNNLYHGEMMEIIEGRDVLSPNIPMDPLGFDWNQQDKQRIVKFHPRLEYALRLFLQILFWGGAAFVLILFIAHTNLINGLASLLYLMLVVLRHTVLRVRLWGKIASDQRDVAGLYLELSPQRIQTVVLGKAMTDRNGKFFLKAPPGAYILRIKEIKQSAGDTLNTETLLAKEILIGKDGVVNSNIKI